MIPPITMLAFICLARLAGVKPEKAKFLVWVERELNKGLTHFQICTSADPLGPDVTVIQLVVGDFSEDVYRDINEANDGVDRGLGRTFMPCELIDHWHPLERTECPGYDEDHLRPQRGEPLKGI